jgi:HlyD family secretion protein
MVKRIVALVLLVVALVAGLLYRQRQTGPLKVSGFVESDEIRIGSRVGGRVARVLVEEGAAVRAHDPLVELEPFQFLELRAQAKAQLAQSEAEFDRMTAGYRDEEKGQARALEAQLAAARDQLADGEEEIAAAQASLDLAQAQLDLARIKFDRVEGLAAKSNASQSDIDQATAELRVARATVRVREEELNRVKRVRPKELEEAEARREQAHQAWLLQDRGFRSEDKRRAEAAVSAARAALDAIDRQIEELTIRAPTAGTIEAIELRPGDLVGANAPALSMIDSDRLWVRAYVPENRLNLAIDREVRVEVDSFPGRAFRGRVIYISRQAEFTPGNVQTPEERSKQVFRIKVLLESGGDVLRPGMAADVLLDSSP